MKLISIQNAIKQFETDNILYQYNQLFPVEYENYDENMSVKEIKALRDKEMTEYIEKLRNIKAKPYDEGNRVIFSHKSNEDHAIFNVGFSMADLNEVKKYGASAATYYFDDDAHENLLSAYIAPTVHTLSNLLPLIAYVLYVGQLYGYNQEHMEEMIRREEAANEAFMQKLKTLTGMHDINELRREYDLPELPESIHDDSKMYGDYIQRKELCNQHWISTELEELKELLNDEDKGE